MITPAEAKAFISANVKRLLAERDWPVIKLAELTGEPQNSIYRVVRGENEPGAVLLARIAEALNTSVDFLLSPPKKKRNSA